MADLLDIADLSEEVPVGEKTLTVYGISAGDLVGLVTRFPALRDALSSGRAVQPGQDQIDAPSLIQEAPRAIGPLLAAGLGHLGEAEYENRAARLPIGVQVDIIDVIIRLSIPDGIGPFVEKIRGWLTSVNVNLQSIESAVGESPLPNGKAESSEPLRSELNG
jgi:hypothetical protein